MRMAPQKVVRMHVVFAPPPDEMAPANLVEPRPIWQDTSHAKFLGIGLGIGAFIGFPLTYFIWMELQPNIELTSSTSYDAILFVLTLLGTLIVHELVHFVAWPRNRFGSGRRVLGVDLKKNFALYSYVEYPVSKNHFVLNAFLPLMVLTVLPVVLSASGASMSKYVVIASIFNCASSGADVLVAIRMFREVRPNEFVQGGYASATLTTPDAKISSESSSAS